MRTFTTIAMAVTALVIILLALAAHLAQEAWDALFDWTDRSLEYGGVVYEGLRLATFFCVQLPLIIFTKGRW